MLVHSQSFPLIGWGKENQVALMWPMSLSLIIFLFLNSPFPSCEAQEEENISYSSYTCPAVCTCSLREIKISSSEEVSDNIQLEVACQDAALLDIFTRLDYELTQRLLLKRVKGFSILNKSRMVELTAKNLLMLRITQSGVKEIQSGAFLNIPTLDSLDLSQNEINQLDDDSLNILESLKFLNLSHNQLSDLGSALTGLAKLIVLDLRSNVLKTIPGGTFSNLTSLTDLKLDGNPLRTLHAESFIGLPNLRVLSVIDCGLTNLDSAMFQHLPHLAILNLSGNRLQTCPEASFLSGLKFLKSIQMGNNEISSLPANGFAGLHLHVVDLSYNRIRELSADTFARASIAHIDLSYNLLLSLSAATLAPLDHHMTELSLAGNPLRILQPKVFSSLEVLTFLNLSACQLESLPHDVIKDLKSLQQLDVSYNKIHFLSEGTLNLLNGVESFVVTGNHWVCDCSISALRHWLNKASNSGKLLCPGYELLNLERRGDSCVETVTCAAPSGLRDQPVSKLSEEELSMCENEEHETLPASTQGAIVASCMGFAIVLLIITIYLWRRGKTAHGLKRVCVPSNANSSHKDAEDDEDDKVPPLGDCRRNSLTNSDHNFVFRHYFDHLVTDPKLMSDNASDLEEAVSRAGENAPLGKKERDSQYSSQDSLYSDAPAFGMESTV